MIVSATKYRTAGRKTSDPIEAQRTVNELRKRWPDREYAVFINTRSNYNRYIPVQVQCVTVSVPTGDDLGLPPAPTPPDRLTSTTQEWDDYRHERMKRGQIIQAAQSSGKAALEKPLNSK